MKPGLFKKNMLILIMGLGMLSSSWAQTVLVHSPPPADGGDEMIPVYSRSAESGIMNALFDRGYIIFSESSDADEPKLRSMAGKVGCEYILSWSLADGGVTGRLISLKGGISESSLVGEAELDGIYQTPEELYTAMGNRLCETLVGE